MRLSKKPLGSRRPGFAVPACGATLSFKTWRSFNFSSTYRVLISTTTQTTAGAYTQIAQWTNSTACPGGAAPPDAAPTSRNCLLSIPATYNGQTVFIAFQHQNTDGANFNLDDVLVGHLAPCLLHLDNGVLPEHGGGCP